MKYPHSPAAFINNIADEGTKEEAIQFLQETWNELQFIRKEVIELSERFDLLRQL